MPVPTDTVIDADARPRRSGLVRAVAERGLLDDPAWRDAVETVPRHRFTPGFYAAADRPSPEGLTRWQPVTARLDYRRWLDSAYRDTTLITQLDGEEPDWDDPAPRDGGSPTSSSTLPSLVVRMWTDAELREGHRVLEVGTGTGYSTALACERLGSDAITSVEVDPHRLAQAAAGLYGCGYAPDLAVADGLYGYWPSAPFDRVVAACAVRTVPAAWLAQTRPGGKILTTLTGWLFGHARVLLTVGDDATATGPLLPGTISFMPARAHQAPVPGNPAHWESLHTGEPITARHTPDWLTEAGNEAFYTRYLAQCAVPDAQLAWSGEKLHLIDVVSGSVATLTPPATATAPATAPAGGGWTVRQHGPGRIWDRIEAVLDAYDAAGRPGPDAFRMTIDHSGQYIRHPRLPALRISG